MKSNFQHLIKRIRFKECLHDRQPETFSPYKKVLKVMEMKLYFKENFYGNKV